MKKILVTGGSGFIGCNLIELLNKLDYEVLNIDDLSPRNSKLSKYWIKYTNRGKSSTSYWG